MTGLSVRIRNVVGIEAATLALERGVLLVGGMNGAGKSTLIQAIASAATGAWQMRGAQHKRELSLLVRRGATEGVILLEYPGGSCRISFPGGSVEQTGKPLDLGTPLGMGAQRFGGLPPAVRLAEVQSRFETAPVRADYDGWFRELALVGMDPDRKAEPDQVRPIDVLWADIDTSGWDAIARRMEGAVRNVQGRWNEATGQRWGSKLRLEWAPLGLHRGETYSLADAQDAVATAKADLEKIVSMSAVSVAERNRLATVARGLAEATAQLAELRAAEASEEAAIEGILEALEADGVPTDPKSFPSCPHCGLAVSFSRKGTGGPMMLEKAPARIDVAAYDAAMLQRRTLQRDLNERRVVASARGRDILLLEHQITTAQRAVEQLAELAHQPIIDDAEIVGARSALLDAEKTRDAITKLQRAVAISEEWDETRAIADAVAVDGIRQRVLERRMSEIGEALREASSSAGMGDLRLLADGSLVYEETPYAMLSASEQWRADFLMGLVLAKRERPGLFLADGLDMLHPQSRLGVLMALSHLGIPAVVTMTAKDPAAVPDLAMSKPVLGRTVWLGGGKVETPP